MSVVFTELLELCGLESGGFNGTFCDFIYWFMSACLAIGVLVFTLNMIKTFCVHLISGGKRF